MHREIFPQWVRPPAVSAGLSADCIDVWRIPLTTRVSSAAPGQPRPDCAPRPAGQHAMAHSSMRSILSRYAGVAADQLQIVVSPGGKPYLDAPGQMPEFNLSHSRDMALLAVAASCAVGIDVETRRDMDDPLRIARRVFSDQELAELSAVADEDRMDRFLNLWTRMEARQKAVGRGIFAQPADPALLSSFSFRPGPRQYAGLSVFPRLTNPVLRFFDYGRR